MNIVNRNKARRDDAAFASMVASPVVGSFTLPANSRIDVSFSAVSVTGNVTITVNGRVISLPPLPARAFHNLGWFERAAAFTFNLGIVGVLTFYTVDAIGVRRIIARSA